MIKNRIFDKKFRLHRKNVIINFGFVMWNINISLMVLFFKKPPK